jgi:putative redox protein
MNTQKPEIDNADGLKLAAQLDLPEDRKPVAYALFAHCFTCTKDFKADYYISRALTRQGIAVVRLDFTGLGESEGDFSDTNFSSNVDDLVAAASYMGEQLAAPQLLVGHSLGGAAVLLATPQIASIRAVATVAAPADPGHLGHLLASSRAEIEKNGKAEVNVAGRKFSIKKQFLDDLEVHHMDATIQALDRPLLILHSPADTVVDMENATHIFTTARQPKSFISLNKADHLLTNRNDADYAGAVLAAWAMNYFVISDQPETHDKPATASGKQVIVSTGQGYRTEIQAGKHTLLADEPTSAGGTDTGPDPYALLLAGLGACTSITLRMYADHKQWPLENIVVRLRHQKIHAIDCTACESDTGKIDLIERDIELSGPIDSTQRKRLLEIADKCPVHRTLKSETLVETRLIDKK